MANSNYFLKTKVPYNEASIESVLKSCSDAISTMTKTQDAVFRLNFAVQELIVNSLEHGYNKKGGEISITISSFNDSIQLEVSDKGFGFDINKISLNNEIKNFNDISIRGWGLFVLNKIFTSLSISSNEPQGTKVTLILAL